MEKLKNNTEQKDGKDITALLLESNISLNKIIRNMESVGELRRDTLFSVNADLTGISDVVKMRHITTGLKSALEKYGEYFADVQIIIRRSQMNDAAVANAVYSFASKYKIID
ncbi:MAG: hypothetical protein HYT12_01505 [Candidatus Liptonbacteria bacterium]|nr:hypothetical protein [Candidatus Liptonbacteria bacterium]